MALPSSLASKNFRLGLHSSLAKSTSDQGWKIIVHRSAQNLISENKTNQTTKYCVVLPSRYWSLSVSIIWKVHLYMIYYQSQYKTLFKSRISMYVLKMRISSKIQVKLPDSCGKRICWEDFPLVKLITCISRESLIRNNRSPRSAQMDTQSLRIDVWNYNE